MQGIDISQWQSNVNWAKVKTDFVILREGYRKTIDKMFLSHVNGAKSANIPIYGVYHFIYTDGATPEENADSTVANMTKAGLSVTNTWIFADLEYDTWTKNGEKVTKAKCSAYTMSYINRLKELGAKKIGVYMNVDYYKNYYTDEVKKYPIWLADYSGETDYDCLVHQYSSKGKVDGISGNVDVNVWNGTVVTKVTQSVTKVTRVTQETEKTMTKTEKAIQWMEKTANDNSHGYDQAHRWGPDYDCSSAVITAWELAGVPVKSNGATYTGNMLRVFKACGFKDVTASVNLSTGSGLVRGDVLLNTAHHTAMYCGDGKEVEASINENGRAVGGKAGDQTGKEFLIRSYRNYPWGYVLRYPETANVTTTSDASAGTFTVKEVRKGSKGNSVLLLQEILSARGYTGLNGNALALDRECGDNLIHALKAYQTDRKSVLAVDGICGKNTWKDILGL